MNFKTEIEVDLDKLKENINILQKTYQDYDFILASIKNNAYGMGYGIVNTLVKNKVNYVLVSTLDEALEVRGVNKNVNIIVSYDINPEFIMDAITHNIIVTISNLESLKNIASLVLKDELRVHILLDNGNNIRGLNNKAELKEALNIIDSHKKINLEGIYTEFTTYGILDEDYYLALNHFLNLLKGLDLKNKIIYANEPLMYHKKEKMINGIRFDLALLGIEENIDDAFMNHVKMKNILKRYQNMEFPEFELNLIFAIKTKVLEIKSVPQNTLIGKNFKCRDGMILARIPVGYKDGITKALKYVVINNHKYPVIADEVDELLIQVSENVKVNDEVELISEERDIYELIGTLNTNRYYLLSILNSNLDRLYLSTTKEDLL